MLTRPHSRYSSSINTKKEFRNVFYRVSFTFLICAIVYVATNKAVFTNLTLTKRNDSTAVLFPIVTNDGYVSVVGFAFSSSYRVFSLP